MRFAQKLGTVIAAFAIAMVMSSRAEAALLTINDGSDIWTLNVQTGCTLDCLIVLQVAYGTPSDNVGLFLDAVQWDLTNPNVNPTTIGFTSTTAGALADWSFTANNINANQCGGGSDNSVCGAFVGTSVPVLAGGFGPIVSGTTLSWTFMSDFAAELTSVTSGNIRAAYNNADGSNNNIFSPGGGNFTGAGSGSGAGQTVPEPASLVLFGAAMLGAAYRSRRNRK